MNRLQRWWTRVRGGVVASSDETWRRAQAGELEFHRTNQWRQTEAFARDTARLFESFGFAPDAFRDRVLMDVGAGSRLRMKYFTGAKIVALEPLAEKFLREIPWSDLKDAHAVISAPAEQLQPEWVGKVDAVFSINVLDHCYAFTAIVANVREYLVPGGLAFLSFDSHEHTDHMHPLVPTEPVCRRHFADAGLTLEKVTRGVGASGPSYGHGETLNFWLRKPLAP